MTVLQAIGASRSCDCRITDPAKRHEENTLARPDRHVAGGRPLVADDVPTGVGASGRHGAEGR